MGGSDLGLGLALWVFDLRVCVRWGVFDDCLFLGGVGSVWFGDEDDNEEGGRGREKKNEEVKGFFVYIFWWLFILGGCLMIVYSWGVLGVFVLILLYKINNLNNDNYKN